MGDQRQPKKAKNKKYAPKRNLYQFRFWLDVTKDDELLLAEEADELKRRRQWQPSVRDALKLLFSLREKRVDVLLMLFPWIEDHFRAKYAYQDSPAVSEFARLVQEQTKILERLATRPTQLPAPMPAPAPQAGPKLLNIPKVADPVFDDDDDLPMLDIKKDKSTDAGRNFLNSLSSLTGMG